MIEQLLTALLRGVVNLAISTAQDAQLREADQLAMVEEYFRRGAELLAELRASYDTSSAETIAAFERARRRIIGELFATVARRFDAVTEAKPTDDETKP